MNVSLPPDYPSFEMQQMLMVPQLCIQGVHNNTSLCNTNIWAPIENSRKANDSPLSSSFSSVNNLSASSGRSTGSSTSISPNLNSPKLPDHTAAALEGRSPRGRPEYRNGSTYDPSIFNPARSSHLQDPSLLKSSGTVSVASQSVGTTETNWPWPAALLASSPNETPKATEELDSRKVAALSKFFGVASQTSAAQPPSTSPLQHRSRSLPPASEGQDCRVPKLKPTLFEILEAATTSERERRPQVCRSASAAPLSRSVDQTFALRDFNPSSLDRMAEEDGARDSTRSAGRPILGGHARSRSRSSAQPIDFSLSNLRNSNLSSTNTLGNRSPSMAEFGAASLPTHTSSSIWNAGQITVSPPNQSSSLAIDNSALEDPRLVMSSSPPGLDQQQKWDNRGARSFSYDYGGLRDDSRYQGGIASTNVSPFTRDGHVLPAFASMQYRNESPTRFPLGLGPVGSGRKRGESLWIGGRPMSYTQETYDEDDTQDDYQQRLQGAQTAASRRHSLAVFTSSSGRSQYGFDIPSAPSTVKEETRRRPSELSTTTNALRFDDDELADSLNSLQLNLGQQPGPQLMPVMTSPTLSRIAPIGSPRFEQQPGFGGLPQRPQQQNQAPSFFQPPAGGYGAPPASQQTRISGMPQAPASNFFGPQFGSAQPPQQARTGFTSPVSQQFPILGKTSNLSANASPFSGATSSSGGFDAHTRPVYFGAQTHQEPDLHEFGRGIPLHQVPVSSSLYIVEFKPGRTDIFYLGDPHLKVFAGDVVIVEADRGKDLGTVVHDNITLDDVQAFQKHQVEQALGQLASSQSMGTAPNQNTISRLTREVHPKRLLGKASPGDLQLLASKASDEAKALALVQNKVLQKNLDMEVVGTEWQFDRRKLTIFYIADKRIDFRELVRELFRLYKTRIWMAPMSSGAALSNVNEPSMGWNK